MRTAWTDHQHASGPPRRRLRGRRGRGEEGAALVEFALVFPFLALILFGILEFGVNTNDYQSIRQAVRDAARQAVVEDYGSGACAPTGSTGAANSAAVQCTARAAADVSPLAVKVVFTDNNGDDDFSTDKVEVCAVTQATSITGLLAPFLSNVYLKSSVEMRAEKNLVLADVQDADPSGDGWSWC